MPFQLLDVDIPADFGEVIKCQWTAYENPFQRFFRLYCPILGNGPNARAESIKESTERQLAWHHSEPEGHWIKVVDSSGKIAGASLWKIFATSPPENGDSGEEEADWHPEGEAREYATKVLEAFDAPRRTMAKRPHVCVADLMMNWGRQKADEMGVEMWVDAGKLGVPVYEKHGFMVVHTTRVQLAKIDPGETWKKMDRELQPLQHWTMWRPPFGDYKEGKVVKPEEVPEKL
ncbi:gcn5-related n-acetyltransferase [Grosmannia clavigera kw1407]|uniref:Gcn5-related n-acetyltransferase n=1 Tax=Grosmannia clavigera (strain kw1407 / UAMH 11150) TaxID=655863 RepID=F0XB22_GROCL|nr:gcn5-related n-acetyltransferase [Grosmannia clavigera kw1407]EFX05102.1 gcn5-related n-acetyltransferase [Grosmannia clavigera kw1407]